MGSVGERLAVLRRRGAEEALEVQAQVRARTEARAGGDLVNVESGGFQQFAGDVDSSPEQPLEGRVAGVLNEAA